MLSEDTLSLTRLFRRRNSFCMMGHMQTKVELVEIGSEIIVPENLLVGSSRRGLMWCDAELDITHSEPHMPLYWKIYGSQSFSKAARQNFLIRFIFHRQWVAFGCAQHLLRLICTLEKGRRRPAMCPRTQYISILGSKLRSYSMPTHTHTFSRTLASEQSLQYDARQQSQALCNPKAANWRSIYDHDLLVEKHARSDAQSCCKP